MTGIWLPVKYKDKNISNVVQVKKTWFYEDTYTDIVPDLF